MKYKRRKALSVAAALTTALYAETTAAQQAEPVKPAPPTTTEIGKSRSAIEDNASRKPLTSNEQSAETPGDQSVRNLILNEDRDQKNMVTKVYKLNHISQDDIEPWIKGAVKRYNVNSTVVRNEYKAGGEHLLLVTTGTDMMPYVDELITLLDRPAKVGSAVSVVDGTGIAMRSYRPKHRADERMIRKVVADARMDGEGWYDQNNNLFYWKDTRSAADKVGKWLETIDRPLPQMALQIKVYEVAENDFKELGMDWLAWKNGPGANLFGTGYDYANYQALTDFGSNTLSSMGGFMFAPQFDTTFLKMLEDKGVGTVATSATLTLINDPDFSSTTFEASRYKISFSPDFQAIQKNSDRQLSVGNMAGNFQLMVNNPMICMNQAGEAARFVRAGFDLSVKEPVDQTNSDSEDYIAYNYQHFSTFMTVENDAERLLGTFVKEHKVTQNSGIPYLCEIPVLKYIFGSSSDATSKTRVFVTVAAVPIKNAANNNALAEKATDPKFLPAEK